MYVYMDLNNSPNSYDKICLFRMSEVPVALRPYMKDIMDVFSQASITHNILVALREKDGQLDSAVWIFDSKKVQLYYDKVQVFLKERNIPFKTGAPELKKVMGFDFPIH